MRQITVPLKVNGRTKEEYRQSIKIGLTETRFKGCVICGDDLPIHIKSDLGEFTICLPCLETIGSQVGRRLQ